MRLGWGVGGNDAERCCGRCPAWTCATEAHDRAARGWRAGCRAARSRAGAASGLRGSPGHAHWRALCGADGLAAGLFSVVFDERFAAQVDASAMR
jgi:cystathionine beta-lyase